MRPNPSGLAAQTAGVGYATYEDMFEVGVGADTVDNGSGSGDPVAGGSSDTHYDPGQGGSSTTVVNTDQGPSGGITQDQGGTLPSAGQVLQDSNNPPPAPGPGPIQPVPPAPIQPPSSGMAMWMKVLIGVFIVGGLGLLWYAYKHRGRRRGAHASEAGRRRGKRRGKKAAKRHGKKSAKRRAKKFHKRPAKRRPAKRRAKLS